MISRPIEPGDREMIERLLTDRWGSPLIESCGTLIDATALPGFVAVGEGGAVAGLVTLRADGDEVEIVTLDALERGRGVGTLLLEAAIEEARRRRARRLWLVTSNDNLDALAFYQKRGLRLRAIHHGSIDDARAVKPSIPLVAPNGIPIRDEIELDSTIAP